MLPLVVSHMHFHEIVVLHRFPDGVILGVVLVEVVVLDKLADTVHSLCYELGL